MKEGNRELFESLFYYDETSPSCLRWKVERANGKIKVGDLAGAVVAPRNPRWQVETGGKRYLVHRIIFFLLKGEIPEGYVVDHENGNRLDNRIINLRVLTVAENSRNCRMKRANKTGITGVHKRTYFFNGKFSEHMVATWRTLDGKVGSKSFSILKYGEDQAKRLAKDFREIMIAELNRLGAGYTERHGKELINAKQTS